MAIDTTTNYYQAEFTNKHGEQFILLKPKSLPTLHITGQELNNGVIPLFNKDFDIWTNEELLRLADAIRQVVADSE